MVEAAEADLARRLDRARRELLGYGDAAMALGAGPRWVLKVGYDGRDGWPAWARWCRQCASPHVPRIGALVELEHAGETIAFLALVERLQPTRVAAGWIGADRLLKRDPLRLAALIDHDHPSVAALLRAAARAFPNARWDAAPSNWMARPDGTLVLNDPLSRPASDLAQAA